MTVTIEEAFFRIRGMSVEVKIQGDALPDFDEGKPEGEPYRWVSTGLWRIEAAVRAAMLAGHVDACREHEWVQIGGDKSVLKGCGKKKCSYACLHDGSWYCDKAKAIEELGR